ncbi:hypothetical protein CCR75_002530 [Bremia lactucae]|uniref:Elicitin n=1 Tax=Bremia lactucae TaxID=4779 RepID=A0A976IJ77_BRELC|nr:hypothetical protein CCR75_002530 [Bremia lactucae]
MTSFIALVLITVTFVCRSRASELCSYTALLEVAGNSNIGRCSKGVGLGGLSEMSKLTTKQLEVVCVSTACNALMKEVAALNLGNCRVPKTEIYIQADILDVFAERCSALGSANNDGFVSSDNLTDSRISSVAISPASIVANILMVFLAVLLP